MLYIIYTCKTMADNRVGNLALYSSNNAFSDWVKQNGGDQSLIEFLFNMVSCQNSHSSTSLKYLNLECEDRQSLLSQLILGQRCLFSVSSTCAPRKEQLDCHCLNPAVQQLCALLLKARHIQLHPKVEWEKSL